MKTPFLAGALVLLACTAVQAQSVDVSVRVVHLSLFPAQDIGSLRGSLGLDMEAGKEFQAVVDRSPNAVQDILCSIGRCNTGNVAAAALQSGRMSEVDLSGSNGVRLSSNATGHRRAGQAPSSPSEAILTMLPVLGHDVVSLDVDLATSMLKKGTAGHVANNGSPYEMDPRPVVGTIHYREHASLRPGTTMVVGLQSATGVVSGEDAFAGSISREAYTFLLISAQPGR